MSKETWWGVPKKVQTKEKLRGMTSNFPKTRNFVDAQSITVRFRGAMIREYYDRITRTNDLVIVSTFQFGREPAVQRLHLMERNSRLGWKTSHFFEEILSVRDFTQKSLKLGIQIYDADTVDDRLLGAVKAVTTTMAVAFPQFAPFAGLANFSGGALLNLIENLKNHECIIDDDLLLESADPDEARNLLQPGHYVCFKEPVKGGLLLGNHLKVVHPDDSAFKDMSYVVLSVLDEYTDFKEWEINQKAAKLLAELKGKGRSGEAPLQFLVETIKGYDRFKKLERATELKQKGQLSASEQGLLDELVADPSLAPYLAQPSSTD